MTDQELNFYMQQLSSAHTAEFDNLAALKELYIYLNKYYGDIVTTLDESPTARKLGLGHKLKSIALSVYPQHQNIWKKQTRNVIVNADFAWKYYYIFDNIFSSQVVRLFIVA